MQESHCEATPIEFVPEILYFVCVRLNPVRVGALAKVDVMDVGVCASELIPAEFEFCALFVHDLKVHGANASGVCLELLDVVRALCELILQCFLLGELDVEEGVQSLFLRVASA